MGAATNFIINQRTLSISVCITVDFARSYLPSFSVLYYWRGQESVSFAALSLVPRKHLHIVDAK